MLFEFGENSFTLFIDSYKRDLIKFGIGLLALGYVLFLLNDELIGAIISVLCMTLGAALLILSLVAQSTLYEFTADSITLTNPQKKEVVFNIPTKSIKKIEKTCNFKKIQNEPEERFLWAHYRIYYDDEWLAFDIFETGTLMDNVDNFLKEQMGQSIIEKRNTTVYNK